MLGRKKTDKPSAVLATTKQELNAAIKRKEPLIEVRGNLARQLIWVKKLSPAKIAALAALLASAAIPSPITPISAVVSPAAIVAVTGPEIAKIILACGISGALILSVIKGYNIRVEHNNTALILTAK